MGLTISWLVEGRIGEVRGFKEVTMDEVLEADRAMIRLLNSKPPDAAMVHFFINFMDVNKFSIPVQNMSQALTHLKDPSMGWTLLVTDNRLIRSTGWLITQVVKARFRTFSSVEDAAAFLTEQDTALPPFAHLLAERDHIP